LGKGPEDIARARLEYSIMLGEGGVALDLSNSY
jgi:hypothetical protein